MQMRPTEAGRWLAGPRGGVARSPQREEGECRGLRGPALAESNKPSCGCGPDHCGAQGGGVPGAARGLGVPGRWGGGGACPGLPAPARQGRGDSGDSDTGWPRVAARAHTPSGADRQTRCSASPGRPAAPGNSNVENLPPHIIRLVYKEVSTLTADPPDGIKVFPNEEDLTDLQVTIEGPEGTPYAGGVFRMKLLLGKDFPASPPKGYFLTKIFHPNVGPTGEICVNVLKKDWTAELGIRHVLLTIKCLLIHPNPESALNEEAGRLLLENYDEYAARARLLTEIHGGAAPSARATDSATTADAAAPGAPGGAEGPMAKKHAGERDKKLAAKKKPDKKRALRRL
ncbi:ubiquitin-conjugating enzyme E2 S isoform X1 [Erinaceus europaeus]|uniref:Ubiquitin-conjugating enzyme E2 S isoform X1 n=1 Tax=Erinaceus europaeus TaxID=9365 RepID=A0ABM3W6W3_ERIEU|nr:ubiquitin-conjugating enzyme E2 S isoform X1 [Erinaceus europaeus]